jgi:glucokinase
VKKDEQSMILAGDVGGTKTNLALFEIKNDTLLVVAEARYVSHDFPSLDELAMHFLNDQQLHPDYACFGVAGPCHDGRCEAMNLPWTVEAESLHAELKVDSVLLINDLEATAYGIAVLSQKDFAVLQEGSTGATGNAAVIAAGTGLGEAGLYWDGQRHRPFACEGGDCDFAPRNVLETGLFKFLHDEFQHVSWERVLSGPGLHHIYRYLRTLNFAEASKSVGGDLQGNDPAAVISLAALEKRCPICVAALELFVSLYGAEAGNLALKTMATDGVYVGGGIAPRIIPAMTGAGFTEAFASKGRLRATLEEVPVRVILTNKAALLGAAQCARLHGEA